MNKPKIVASTTSLKSTRLTIKAGADEIFLGIDYPDLLKRITFTGRGKYSCYNVKSVVTASELEDIVKMAHDNNVTVSYLANMPAFPKGIEDEFLKYIEKGIACNIDAIITANLTATLLIEKNWPDIPLHAGSIFGIFNLSTVEFLKKYNFTRLILPHHLTLKEVTKMVDSSGLETEIFGLFGCSNIGGQCHLKHNAGERIDLGLPCRAKYKVVDKDKTYDDVQFFHAGRDCPLCHMKEIIETRVDYIKIFGRDKDPGFLAGAIRLFKNVIEKTINDGISQKEIKTFANKIFPWWATCFCSWKGCKYKDDQVEQYYITN